MPKSLSSRTLSPPPPRKHKRSKGFGGFTLAETLITLAIIGVIATLTIPNLFYKHQEAQIVSGVSTAIQTLSEALKLAQIENGPINDWDIAPADTDIGSAKLATYLKPYLRIQKDCAYQNACLGSSYTTLMGGTYYTNPITHSAYYKLQLENGMALTLDSYGSCKNKQLNWNICGSGLIDLNGPKGPNKGGIDLFHFIITTDRIIPSGVKGYENNYNKPCVNTKPKDNVGTGCTSWVLYKRNTDYRKKIVRWD